MSKSRLEKYLPGNKRVRMLVLMMVDIGVFCMGCFFGLFIRFVINNVKITLTKSKGVVA